VQQTARRIYGFLFTFRTVWFNLIIGTENVYLVPWTPATLPSGAKEAIQEIVDSEKKCTGNITELSIMK
jgi:hypothetical protein